MTKIQLKVLDPQLQAPSYWVGFVAWASCNLSIITLARYTENIRTEPYIIYQRRGSFIQYALDNGIHIDLNVV